MSTLDRRRLIAGALLATSLPRLASAAPTPTTNLHLNILRNGKPFGQYQVSFVSSGDAVTATTDVAMNMRISGLTVFDYKHHCEETWRGGRFMELHSQSVRDGQSQAVSAVRSQLGISITNKAGLLAVPGTSNPLTHWNQSALQGPLFNPQDGMPLRLTAQSLGHDPVTLGSGAKLTAAHWALRGESEIDDWYDEAGVWAGLRAVFPDKSIVEYRRV